MNIFVFGSNLAGRHGRGAALIAKYKYGAVQGIGVGMQGMSYAIPTKDADLKPLPLETIAEYIKDFFFFVTDNPHLTFILTPIGTGLAGYKVEQILPIVLSMNVPDNVVFHKEWFK